MKQKQYKHVPSGDIWKECTGPANVGLIHDKDGNKVPIDYTKGKDWEEVKPKEWEITSFNLKDSLTIRPRGKSGLFYYDREGHNEFTEESLLTNRAYEIYSVKRLSDGVEFKIGDKVECPNGKVQPIQYFVNDGYSKWVGIVNKFEAGGPHNISQLQKIEKLFTTEDGVDIYEGDNFVFVDKQTLETTLYQFAKKGGIYKSVHCKYFSTKERAEDYILMNKPCLSMKDVLSIRGEKNLCIYNLDLKNLVKSKLK